jgi:ribose transport system substrate-binding protein
MEEETLMKKLMSIILVLVLAVSLLAACGTKPQSGEPSNSVKPTTTPSGEPAKSGMKVGMAVQDLSNPIWSGSAEALKKLVEAGGGSMSYVACDSNVTKQIQQIENFIASGIDALVVHPADPAGVENVLKQARDAGVKVYSWDDNLENADLAWLIDNYELGYMIGEEAAKWINEKLGGVAEVAVLDYPQLPILLERGNGIVDAIKKLAPNAKIVAQTSAINPAEGISKMETIFQSNPNVKVVACIGGGGAVGANEAAKAAGKITDDFGIFAADATDPELEAIKNKEGNRMSVLITGGPDEIAKEIYGWLEKLVAGEKVEKEVYRVLIPVTAENLSKYYK